MRVPHLDQKSKLGCFALARSAASCDRLPSGRLPPDNSVLDEMLRRALVSLVAAAVVGSDAAAAPSSCITNTTNATADARVYELSRKFQCPDVDVDAVPMACAWTTAWQRRVFHLHMSKMAGREVLARAPAAIDVRACPGEAPGALATFRGHVRPPAAPCFYSYETT